MLTVKKKEKRTGEAANNERISRRIFGDEYPPTGER